MACSQEYRQSRSDNGKKMAVESVSLSHAGGTMFTRCIDVSVRWPGLVVLCGLIVSICRAAPIVVGFEGLADSTVLTNQYSALYGVTFSNTVVVNTLVLSKQVSLNEFEFPPHSGTNVVTDNGGPMTIKFASPASAVGGY